MMNKKIVAVSILVCCSIAGTAQAALHDRGGGLIYDDVLNITWLQDANYATGSSYDNGWNTQDGFMNWQNAVEWAANLTYFDSVRNVSYDDWRLPTVSPVNGSTFIYYRDIYYTTSYNGSTDRGYNISEQGTLYAGSTGSEMAHLFYNSLNNKGLCDPVTSTASSCAPLAADYGLVNVGPFINVQSNGYWSGTEYAPNTQTVWSFFFDRGYQTYDDKIDNLYAWAVRDGDVAAIPEPEAYAMFLAGLGLVGFMAQRRKHTRIQHQQERGIE